MKATKLRDVETVLVKRPEKHAKTIYHVILKILQCKKSDTKCNTGTTMTNAAVSRKSSTTLDADISITSFSSNWPLLTTMNTTGAITIAMCCFKLQTNSPYSCNLHYHQPKNCTGCYYPCDHTDYGYLSALLPNET